MDITWRMLEPGWWISEAGAICCYGPQEWFFWQEGKELDEPVGPYQSLKMAKAAAFILVGNQTQVRE